jgi:hypothetical protein
MSPKKKAGFDDIFAETTADTGKKKPAKKAAKASPKKTAAKASPPKAAAKIVAAAAPMATASDRLTVDTGAVLQTAWTNHEQEVLYRKGKEDRLLMFSVAILAILTLGAAYVLGSARLLDWWWLSKFVFRIVFVVLGLGIAFAGNALIELNRKRLQDVLAMVVKIQENLGLFAEGAVPGSDGAFFPNTYKFIGSINDDETNYAQMLLKVAAAAAALTILLLV